MAYLNTGDARIYYEISGEVGEAGGRLSVLLSHGFGASSQMWEPNLAALATTRPVITWDLRGHGQSESPEQEHYTRAASVADMVALLDQAGAPRAILGGLSLGGYLSLAFYLEHPERVAALVLCDTGPGFRNDQARQEWNDRAMAQADRLDSAGLAALGKSGAQHRSAAGVARAARGILTQQDASVIESLPSIAVPTLVLVGSRDTAFLGAASYLTAKITGAAQVIIEDAGHMSNIDAPAEFNKQVLSFLSSID
jgi:pimeloyl-ACP methyl ester carboxylesterase